MKIKNDPSVIDHTPIVIRDGCMPTRWVLRHIPENHLPYVIHQENMKLESDGNTWVHDDYYNGTYFGQMSSAYEEFEKRFS